MSAKQAAGTLGELAYQWIGVTLPKSVFIENFRLGVLDLLLKGGAIAYIVYTFISNTDSFQTIFKPDAAITLWSEDGRFQKLSDEQHTSDLCNPALNDKYDYWYDEQWRYTNMTCIALGVRERAIKTSARSMYVPTYTSETFTNRKLADLGEGGDCDDARCKKLGVCSSTGLFSSDFRNGKGQCLCKCEQSKNVTSTGVEAINVVFSHWPLYGDQLKQRLEDKGEMQPTSSEEAGMTTIAQYANGSEYRRFEPGESIRMTIEEMLQLAGLDKGRETSYLDLDGDKEKENYLLDPTFQIANAARKESLHLPFEYMMQLKKYPAMRVTGARVTLHIRYYNSESPEHENEELKPNAVAYLKVHVIPQWQGYPISDYFAASEDGEAYFRSRYYQGLRIDFDIGGSYGFFDPVKFLVNLAAAFVYFMIPNMLMQIFTKFCLGTLSDIYYRAQTQVLDYWELFSGEVTRALVGMFTYNKLLEAQVAAQGGEDYNDEYLEWQTMKEQIIDLFEEQECLSANEMDVLLSVLLKILSNNANNKMEVTQVAWVEAYVNADVASLRCWADFFDSDRSRCCCEKLFDTTARERKQYSREGRGSEHHISEITEHELSAIREKHKKKRDRLAQSRNWTDEDQPSPADQHAMERERVSQQQVSAIMDEIETIEPGQVNGHTNKV